MTIGAQVAIAASSLGVLSLLSGLVYRYGPEFRSNDITMFDQPPPGAIPGRIVQILSKDYRQAFKVEAPKLGQCALKMTERSIKTCSEKFEGEVVYIPRGSTVVSVSRVQSDEDVVSHIMGGLGVSVGVLGLASASVNMKVAVTTKTSSKSVRLMSSYSVQRGTFTLQHPRPVTPVGRDGTLFLSEIDLGGSEVLLVTMEFESEAKKTEVELTVKVKILFITITAKMQYIKETFKTASWIRVQSNSTWRGQTDNVYDSFDQAIREVEKIENTYVTGPEELNAMDINDEKLHHLYYFSAWNRGPYGENLNLGIINNDLDTLNKQNAEAIAVMHRISDVYGEVTDPKHRLELENLNKTVASIRDQLTSGLDSYHTMTTEQRTRLRDVYGSGKAPLYYQRKLQSIISSK